MGVKSMLLVLLMITLLFAMLCYLDFPLHDFTINILSLEDSFQVM